MAIFNSYVKLPEGKPHDEPKQETPITTMAHGQALLLHGYTTA
jgi:hypothetical protein